MVVIICLLVFGFNILQESAFGSVLFQCLRSIIALHIDIHAKLVAGGIFVFSFASNKSSSSNCFVIFYFIYI